MSILTREGFSNLKFTYIVFVVGLGAAVFLAGGSYLYWQAEKKNTVQSQRTLGDMQSRLANAQREKEDLRNSEDTYNALTARGVFIAEKRLDLLDAMEQLKIRHKLVTLEYEMSAQRPLKLASGAALTAVDALGSRIRIKATSLHDADLIAFLDEFPRIQRGLFPIDRCTIRRKSLTDIGAVSPAPSGILGSALSAASGLARRLGDVQSNITRAEVTDDEPLEVVKANLEADCTLEWITLLDKRAPAPAKTAATSGGGGVF